MAQSVLIIEDHPLFRNALVQIMQVIVGEKKTVAASSAEEALTLINSLPDLGLILLDPGLPGLNGVEAVVAFRRRCPLVPIVVVSASEDRAEAMAALRAGAKAFVSKAAPTEIIFDVAKRLLAGTFGEAEWITPKGKMTIDEASEVKLTPRQQEILVMLSQGYANKEIGLRLNLAEITVKNHVSGVFKALDVVNRTQAVLAGRRLGLCAAPVDLA
jgi:DNA-binding NarL/FixJ family response regulator